MSKRIGKMTCPCCGLPVVDSSIVPDTQGMCDHCYKIGPIITEKLNGMTNRQSTILNMVLTQTLPEDVMLSKEGFTSVEERIGSAVYMASAKFWEVVADLFPECKTGDLEPLYIFKMEETMKETVTHWVENNKPAYKDAEGKPEDWTEGMYLHYPGVWHMHHTGGGCMVVTSDNVVVAMEHRYMGITAECVMIYTDTFAEDSFLNVYDDANVWSFGDNPTVLMNIIDEWFGGSALWNTGHLFDDIMTIAKSGKC